MKFWKKMTAVLAAAVLLCCMMSTAVSAAEMPDTSEVKNQIDAGLQIRRKRALPPWYWTRTICSAT